MRRLAVLGSLLALVGCGGGNDPATTPSASVTPASTPTPTAFTSTGEISISKYDSFVVGSILETDDGDSCTGDGGYDDIQGGTQVVVRTSDGTTVAIGELRGGRIEGSRCSFEFTVEDVPTGEQFYSVEVGSRGELQYTADEIREPLLFTLG